MPDPGEPGSHDEFVQHAHLLPRLFQLDQRGVPLPARLLLGCDLQSCDLPGRGELRGL